MIGEVLTGLGSRVGWVLTGLVVGTYWAQLTMICGDLRLSRMLYIRVVPALTPTEAAV